VVLNSAKAAIDLLESRASIYSDRPVSRMIQLAGRELSVFWISSVHPRFKRYRKILQSGLASQAVLDYHSVLKRQSISLMQALHREPEAFMQIIQRCVPICLTRKMAIEGDDV
jgi:cytochrome P450